MFNRKIGLEIAATIFGSFMSLRPERTPWCSSALMSTAGSMPDLAMSAQASTSACTATAASMFVAIFTVAASPVAPIFYDRLLVALSIGSALRNASPVPPM